MSRSLSPGFYQTLLDRCWRRSGRLIYRPDQKRSCCPYYTIRLDSNQFKPSREQRQAVNRFTNFVLGDAYIKEAARLYPRTRQEVRRREHEFSLVERIHEAKYAFLKTPPEPAHRFDVTLEEDAFTEEKFQVYHNYQMVVHKEDASEITRESFRRFLCNSPLRREAVVEGGQRKIGLGSYHQCYRLDGVLVAIGVLDVLPNCISSVYFLYLESVQKHAPGKLSALHEIALALENGCQWWYPGYYIHSCPKMRYKTNYAPQFILDPEALCWDPLDSSMMRLLDEKRYVSLSAERQNALATREGGGGGGGDTRDAQRTQLDGSNGDSMEMDTKKDSGEDGEDGEATDDKEDEESLFTSGMPGISSISDMMKVDLDNIPVRIPYIKNLLKTSDLVDWESKKITDWPNIKAGVAELVAAMGPDLIDSLCLDMSCH